VTLKGGKPPLVVGHVTAPGKSSNGSLVCRSLPLRCFDRAPITQGRAPCASQSPLGVFPFSCECRCKGGRRVEAGRNESCVALLPTRRCWRPTMVGRSRTRRREGRGRPRRGRDAEAERDVGRRRERPRRATISVKPATSTPPPCCENHGLPLLLRRSQMPECEPSSRCVPLYPHERRHAAPHLWRPRTVATPGRNARRAAMPCAERRVVPRVLDVSVESSPDTN
jgi:hypothetical protein